MNGDQFHGVFPYLVSPVDRDGNVKADVLSRLAQIPNIKYVKEASSNTGRLMSIINRVGDSLPLREPLSLKARDEIRQALIAVGGL